MQLQFADRRHASTFQAYSFRGAEVARRSRAILYRDSKYILISRSSFDIIVLNRKFDCCSRLSNAEYIYSNERNEKSLSPRLIVSHHNFIPHRTERGGWRGEGERSRGGRDIISPFGRRYMPALRRNARTSGNIIATRESGINTLFVCHSSCEDQHKCTPRATRGYS